MHWTAWWLPGTNERGMVLHMALSPHPAHHRFPVWWTGDDKSMAYSVQSMVDLGVTQLKPYVHYPTFTYPIVASLSTRRAILRMHFVYAPIKTRQIFGLISLKF